MLLTFRYVIRATNPVMDIIGNCNQYQIGWEPRNPNSKAPVMTPGITTENKRMSNENERNAQYAPTM